MAYRSDPEYISSVLGKAQVRELIGMRVAGHSIKEIARHFSVHRNTVTNILKRAARSPEYDYNG